MCLLTFTVDRLIRYLQNCGELNLQQWRGTISAISSRFWQLLNGCYSLLNYTEATLCLDWRHSCNECHYHRGNNKVSMFSLKRGVIYLVPSRNQMMTMTTLLRILTIEWVRLCVMSATRQCVVGVDKVSTRFFLWKGGKIFSRFYNTFLGQIDTIKQIILSAQVYLQGSYRWHTRMPWEGLYKFVNIGCDKWPGGHYCKVRWDDLALKTRLHTVIFNLQLFYYLHADGM